MYYLIQEILVNAVLNVHVKGVRITSFFFYFDVLTMYLLQKGFIEKYMC